MIVTDEQLGEELTAYRQTGIRTEQLDLMIWEVAKGAVRFNTHGTANDDLISDVWCRVVEKIHLLDPNGQPVPYIFVIAKKYILRHYERAKNETNKLKRYADTIRSTGGCSLGGTGEL